MKSSWKIVFYVIFYIVYTSFFSALNSVEVKHHDLNRVMVEADDALLYCCFKGEGKPVFVIHGGPGLSHDYLIPAMDHLSKDYLLILYDQRACGRSSGQLNSESINVEKYIDDLEAIRKHFGLQKISILGHSWGGLLALNYAVSHPENIEKLILSNSLGGSNSDFALFLQNLIRIKTPYLSEIEAIESSAGFKEGNPDDFEKYYRLVFGTHFYDATKVDLLNLKMSRKSSLNGLVVCKIFEENLFSKPFNLYSKLETLSIPTLIFQGEVDSVPIEISKNLHKNLLGSRYLFIDECGHFPFVEQPDIFFNEVNNFLND